MEEDDPIDNLLDIVIEGMPTYDRTSFIANNSIKFKEKTLDEWSLDLSFPDLQNDLTLDELEVYNSFFVKKSDIIMINLASANSSKDLSRLSYARAAMNAKQQILDERISSGARAPGAEILDNMARTIAINEYSSYKISCMLYEFWKIQYDKLKLIDSRLTGMNILRNVESKYASHQ